MPTYEYKCTECDERFEIEQSIQEDTLALLAGDDHEHQLKKLFSPVGISFKGGGFYRNDARKSSSSSSSDASNGAGDTPTKVPKSDTSSKGDSSTTSTPAKKESTSASSD